MAFGLKYIAFYVHILYDLPYLLACSLYLCVVLVWCLPDVYLTHSWVHIFQVLDSAELCDVLGKIFRCRRKKKIALHSLFGNRFPGRRAASVIEPVDRGLRGVTHTLYLR